MLLTSGSTFLGTEMSMKNMGLCRRSFMTSCIWSGFMMKFGEAVEAMTMSTFLR